MDKENIINFYEDTEREHLLFSYKGEVTPEVILELIRKSEQLLGEKKENKRIEKRLCNIVIESLQNLYHHQIDPFENSSEIQEIHKNMIFMITFKDGFYHVHTGNFMNTADTKKIKQRISEINNLSDLELKESYKSKLANGAQSKKGTAGLGFIDMRRKSGLPLNYNFHELSAGLSFFCLDITINTL
ncbi:SiaB family protein kinase [Lishizhenia sp.]|uniref:SiaB family protein kinase n=1 Tax=Lishizhenia sp. TaxID=2497594 RepID=UPI00299CD876|nr:SiaB family protein kinase [Lishizhenia sp.]MDX1447154.1 SiaB family protein kinase [Lishizhenia sp.]